jgi:hypothetical protein
MPIGVYNHPLFGLVKFKTKSSDWVYGDPITFIDGFDPSDVTTVTVPQLKNTPGASKGKLRFHKRGHKQLLAAFGDIEKLGLLKYITSSAGAYNSRLKKPTSGKLSKEPSNHSFGIAIDLNHDDGCLGCTTAPLAPVFVQYGFKWGKSFKDPMHYEVQKFIDNPMSEIKDVQVLLAGTRMDLGAKNIFGELFLDARRAKNIPDVTVVKETPTTVSIRGRRAAKSLRKVSFGDLSFIPLPQAVGVAGLSMDFDQKKKVVIVQELA